MYTKHRMSVVVSAGQFCYTFFSIIKEKVSDSLLCETCVLKSNIRHKSFFVYNPVTVFSMQEVKQEVLFDLL